MATTRSKKIILDEYQRKVLVDVANGENLFITGKAGTGKTALLREVRKMYAGKKVVAVLAPTGVAARNAEGSQCTAFCVCHLNLIFQNIRLSRNYINLMRVEQKRYVVSTSLLLTRSVWCAAICSMQLRVVQYKGINRLLIQKEEPFNQGYAICFENIVRYVNAVLPSNEDVNAVQLSTTSKFPLPSVREAIANAILCKHLHKRDYVKSYIMPSFVTTQSPRHDCLGGSNGFSPKQYTFR